MKFAVAALITSTSAIRINNKEAQCVSHRLAREGFSALDTNHNGSLSYDEIQVGVQELAHSLNHTISADEWAWIQ